MPPPSVAPGAINLLKKLLVSNPSRRLSLAGVMNHPWILTVTEVRELKKMCIDIIALNPANFDTARLPPDLLAELKEKGVL
jgi:hypothetical protein